MIWEKPSGNQVPKSFFLGSFWGPTTSQCGGAIWNGSTITSNGYDSDQDKAIDKLRFWAVPMEVGFFGCVSKVHGYGRWLRGMRLWLIIWRAPCCLRFSTSHCSPTRYYVANLSSDINEDKKKETLKGNTASKKMKWEREHCRRGTTRMRTPSLPTTLKNPNTAYKPMHNELDAVVR